MHAASIFFFFNNPATTEIYTLSLHDALPIYVESRVSGIAARNFGNPPVRTPAVLAESAAKNVRRVTSLCIGLDRKSTRLNSSHTVISYAVFCLKKKKISHIVFIDLCL